MSRNDIFGTVYPELTDALLNHCAKVLTGNEASKDYLGNDERIQQASPHNSGYTKRGGRWSGPSKANPAYRHGMRSQERVEVCKTINEMACRVPIGKIACMPRWRHSPC